MSADACDDVTGDRNWDSGTLLERVLTDQSLCAQVLPSVAMPPAECIELGAGTGRMALALMQHWPLLTRYVATDLPQRVAAIVAASSSKERHHLQNRLCATPLTWGERPPSPLLSSAGTYLVLLADLIYFSGKDLLEPDTLEPLAETLKLALAHPRAVAVFAYRERDPEREAHFCAICEARGMQVDTALLDAATLAALLPESEQHDVERSLPLKIWRLTERGTAVGPE